MLLQRFQQHITQQFHLQKSNCRLIIAVSGGVDSVVLTDLAAKCGFDFIIAHCNFLLRGEESERDAAFVKLLGEKYNKEVLVKRFDTTQYAEENKLSIQEAARELRYRWFEEIATGQLSLVDNKSNVELQTSNHEPQTSNLKLQAYILTAHHADDNIETLLINFFRGTGISGLHGILPKQGKIIRPLLFATREEILAYAKENILQWVEDTSNTSDKYTRNFFRNKLLPSIEEVFPKVHENLLQNIHRFTEAEILYHYSIEQHKKRLCEYKEHEVHISILKLQKSVPLNTIIWEIIKDYGFHSTQTEEVKKLFDAENGRYIQSESHRVIKNRKWLIIAPNKSKESQHILIQERENHILFSEGKLEFQLQTTNNKQQTINSVALLNAAEIRFPLLLRKWKQGDYFYPLGMRKKKKLSRFFIDLKLSKTEKEKVWVLESNKKIMWVVGYRIDDRFKITDATKNILQIVSTKSNSNLLPAQ